MNYSELLAEFAARGFDYLDSARAGRYINQSYASICNRAQWPFLEDTVTGTAPLEITDLRAVLSVVDTTTTSKLYPMDRRMLIENVDTDLTAEGTPSYWYQEDRTTINIFPVASSDSLSVHYLKVPDVLTSVDEHLIPTEFEDLIIDGAAIKAYKDDDEFESAGALLQFYNEGLREMIDALISRNHSHPNYIMQTNTYEMGGY